MAFYLDDGVIAGDAMAVKLFLIHLVKGLDAMGLEFRADKSWVIPCATDTRITAEDFQDYRWTPDGHFHLLGAPIGSTEWCTEHTSFRLQKAKDLMEIMAKVADPQCALIILKECLAYCKVVSNMRCLPPALHRSALENFTLAQQKTVEAILNGPVHGRSWE